MNIQKILKMKQQVSHKLLIKKSLIPMNNIKNKLNK